MKANRYLIVAIFIVVAYNTKIMMPISNIDMGLFILMTLIIKIINNVQHKQRSKRSTS